MENKNYWLNLFTGSTWEEFVSAGGNVTGFRENRRKTVKKIRPGDYLLCYATGISRFIGILKVVSFPYFEKGKLISNIDLFPARVPVETLVALEPETAVPVLNIKDQLPMFNELKNPNSWGILFRSSPKLLSYEDGIVITESIQNAQKNPISRDYEEKKWKRKRRY